MKLVADFTVFYYITIRRRIWHSRVASLAMILLDQIAFVPARKPYQIVVVNPDLQIERGWGHPDTEIRGEPRSQKNILLYPSGLSLV